MENLYSCIEDIKDICSYPPMMINGSKYMLLQRQLAKLYLLKKNELEAIYHLTESHGFGMRQLSLMQNIKTKLSSEKKGNQITEVEIGGIDPDHLSLGNNDTSEGMMNRLRELPKVSTNRHLQRSCLGVVHENNSDMNYDSDSSAEDGNQPKPDWTMILEEETTDHEWTVVQLTREFDEKELFKCRLAETSVQPKGLHITRLPCGSHLENGAVPITFKMPWPECDFLKLLWECKKNLGTRHGSASYTRKIRSTASSDLESHVREIGPMCFKEWIVLLLGSLYDSELQNEIRSIVDNVNELSGGCMSDRQRYLIYLVAEGCCHLSENEINSALDGILPDNKSERKVLFQAILEIKSTFTGKLMTAKRYPLILILDEHFEVIPWECMPILRRHPVSRVVSLHFLYALFKLHQPHIRNGLREIADNDICYYIINPDGDLPSVEEKLAKFLKIRLPHWVGIVGQKPTEEQLIEALTTKNTFVYCGHGSGCQYMSMEVIQKLKVRPVQMLYGCCSAGLKDHGGIVEMTGDVLQYTIAGSGCTLGMLWSVMSNDTDKMTMVLANTWLPGKPVDINTFEEIKDGSKSQEPELLRAMKEVRDCVGLFSNGAAFIARGIPIVLVSAE